MVNADVRKFLPGHLLEVFGKNLPAIINALNNANENSEKTIQACIDMLFLSSASGRYLINLGNEQGFILPLNSGLDVRAYKVLVPIMVSSPKQVRISIDDLIQAFYGSQRVKPSIQSGVSGPYSLASGDNIIIETEKGITEIPFIEGQVSDLTAVSAQEIASVINTIQSDVIADTVTDRLTGLSSVRLTSATRGTGAFIRIAGGTLQNVLKFPKLTGTASVGGTNYLITKKTSYTDLVKFQWDGVGTNPNIYLTPKDSAITIRGLVDGVEDFSKLNGSYIAVDVGYDYFFIRNTAYNAVSASLTHPDNSNFEFTSPTVSTIFDNDEYAYSSETSEDSITVTVPAVPPLVRRFLEGSAHLQGNIMEILDFTRGTIQVQVKQGETIPVEDNAFNLSSNTQRNDFRKKPFKTFLRNIDPNQPIYSVLDNDPRYSVLPFTDATAIQANPIYGEIESEEYRVVFPYRHGFQNFWGITLAGATGSANVTAPMLNKEHSVLNVLKETEIALVFKDTSGNPVKYQGVTWNTADLYRHQTPQSDGSDFYLQFSSPAAALASGLTDGTTFNFDTLAGTDVVPYIAGDIRYRKCTARSTNGNLVNISVGLGVGLETLIIQNATGKRSSFFGGTPTHKLDKTSAYNMTQVLDNLKATFMFHTPSENEAYVGSFIYDPAGVASKVTVSKYVTKMTQSISKGENVDAIFVDSVTSADGLPIPTSGDLVVDYGTGGFEGPIRYFAVVENSPNNQILIDPSYKFKSSHDVGSSVQFIHSKTQFVPSKDGLDYPVYLTGSVAARDTLFKLIELLTAAGIFVEKDVILPELRYADPAISPFT